jgi:hypothetical protein
MKKAQYFYLLRRGFFSGGGLDSDYQAVLDYATSQGWDLPSAEQQTYQSALLRTLKKIGVWDKLDRFFLHTTDSRNFARIDWVNPSSNPVAVNGDIGGTLGFTDNEGFHTDGVSYLNYRYNPTSDGVNVSQNSMSVGMYEWAVSSSNAGLLIGSDDASNDVVLTANFGGNAFLALNDDSTGFTPSITYKTGLYVGIRDGATSLRFYDADGTEYLDADPSTGLNSVDFAALKYGASSFSSTDVRAGLFFVGSEMVAEVSQLYTAVGDYYSSLNELLKPSNTAIPVISGTLNVGKTLTTTNGTWDNSPTAYSYQWLRGGAAISGATSSTYVLVGADEDEFISCKVTASNVYGSADATSAQTTAIGPSLFSGLLDDYSGAAAAYSLRLLRSGYSGNAIKVRRASDNTEQDIGFVDNELDTSSLESFCSGTDGFVTTWYDQSGSNNAAQTTASKQAKIVSSGSTITQNGKPTLEFDSSSSQDFDVSISISTTEYSNFIVEASDDAPNTSTQVMYGVSTSVFYTRLRSIDLESRVSSSPIINLDDDFAYTTSQQYLISIINGASQGAHYIDGSIGNKSPKDTSTSGGITSSTLSLASANGAFYFNGKIQEMVFYFNDESTNQTGIETNINNFYSIF